MDKYPDLNGTAKVVTESKAERKKRKEKARARMAKRLKTK